MLMIILVTTLVAIITLIISSLLYLVAFICDQSDDEDGTDSLAIDTHDFRTTPTTSPVALLSPITNCENRGHHHHCNNSNNNDNNNNNNYNYNHDNDRPELPVAHTMVAPTVLVSNLGPNIVRDDDASPVKMKPAALDGSGGGQKQPPPKSPTDVDHQISTWSTSATAQKTIIANQLGTPISKQLFEDFDPKEMQLGGTGLHWCKTRKSLDRLVKLGLPLDIVNKRRETALHVAVRKKKLPILIGLLCHGAEVDCRNENGETPLLLACKLNDIFACQLLLIFDSDVNQVDKNGLSSRHYAAAICDKHKVQQQQNPPNQPNAAHLILAMLNEMDANRCPKQLHLHTGEQSTTSTTVPKPPTQTKTLHMPPCTDGCSETGTYNGNSYNRWPDYQKESLYKRHMFSDIIEDHMRRQPRATAGSHPKANVKSTRLFCIDGGGMRGVIVCQIMIEMEKYLAKPMISYFDWIGGTSVGAFLACALCAGTTLRELRRISFDVKDEVFSGNKPYNSKFLERVLKRTLGVSARMSDIKDKKLAVTTVIADRDPCQLKFFKNYKSPGDILERYGYAADMFDMMSGHSIVTTGTTRALSVKQPSSASSTAPATVTATKITTQLKSPTSSSSAAATGRLTTATTTNIRAAKQSSQLQQQIPPPFEDDDGSLNDDEQQQQQPRDSRRADQSSERTLDESEQDPLMWQAVRASGAAPFFFKPYGPYLDGGIISNNPTLDMLTEFYSYERVKSFLRNRITHGQGRSHVNNNNNNNNKETGGAGAEKNDLNVHEEPANELELVVSLGTGRGRIVGKQAMINFGNVASGFATVFSPVELLRSIRAARDLFKKLMHRSCMTDDHILDRAQAWCASLNIPYFRINPPLANIFSIDDKRDEQLINALWQTKLYMRAMSPQLKQLAKLLDGP